MNILTTNDKYYVMKQTMMGHGYSKLAITRAVVASQIMGVLNERRDYSVHLYDCGKLGVLLLHCHHRWREEWYDLEPLPEGIQVKGE